MSFPWHDWQFWTVTALAGCCAVVLLWQLVPRPTGPPCGGCASGAAACAKQRQDGAAGESGLVSLGGRRGPSPGPAA